MAISVSCGKCQATLRLKDEFAGKRGKCPRCRAFIDVPSESSNADPTVQAAAVAAERPDVPGESPAPAAATIAAPVAASMQESASRRDRAALQQELLAAFNGRIVPVRTSLAYRLGVLVVSLVMVLLPIVYLTIVALVIYGVYYHAVNNTELLAMGRGRGRLVMVAVYATPLVAGGILVFFMIKPLLARQVDSGRTRSLTRQGEPLLFAFVDRLCEAVGAPQPRRIDVDCQVNASAHFRRGLLSMFGSDLVLTIGVPLAAGLTVGQFAGVLAHEFGHFTQGIGMRVSYLIRSINFWFVRVVYERDQWDAWLETAADDSESGFVKLILLFSQAAVWLTRRVLWALMLVGHAVSGFLLRQMEYDADRHEARLVGAAEFEATSRRLPELMLGMNGAEVAASGWAARGRLGDDLPRLMLAMLERVPYRELKKVTDKLEERKTGLFDSHPAQRDRIASARREEAPPVFVGALPATVLFTDFDTLARNVTGDVYRHQFGSRFKPTAMCPLQELLAAEPGPAGSERVR